MDLEVDHKSSVPPFEQVRAGLAEQIVSGELAVGTRLPTVRSLAGDLGLAVNTVARAYRELETAGLVLTKGRSGTFVHTGNAALEHAHTAARAYAAVVRASGLDIEEAVRLLRAAFDSSASTA